MGTEGPIGWKNWQAELAQQPARSSASRPGSSLLTALWEERALYSDAALGGTLRAGPHEFFLTLARESGTIGQSSFQIVLRTRDHLLDGDPEPFTDTWGTEPDSDGYVGGDVADEFAALMALALGRRMRSGGLTRHSHVTDGVGEAIESAHRPPVLYAPRHGPLLPGIAADADIGDAADLFAIYSRMAGRDARGLARAATEYADALWWADADPRIAWIKLVGALETAGNHWWSPGPGPVPELQRLHTRLYKALKPFGDDAVAAAAEQLTGMLGAQAKFLGFVEEFPPAPPLQRPTTAGARLDWSLFTEALRQIYALRSADLHAGIPFPAPMCEAPPLVDGKLPAEVFPALGAESDGGKWRAEALPMYLHTFAFIVRSALCSWWRSMDGPQTPADLATRLRRDPKTVRAWLREQFPRDPGQRGRRWQLGAEHLALARLRWPDSAL